MKDLNLLDSVELPAPPARGRVALAAILVVSAIGLGPLLIGAIPEPGGPLGSAPEFSAPVVAGVELLLQERDGSRLRLEGTATDEPVLQAYVARLLELPEVRDVELLGVGGPSSGPASVRRFQILCWL